MPAAGTAAKDKPPVFGMIQRCGDVVIKMLDNVRKKNHRTDQTSHNKSWHPYFLPMKTIFITDLQRWNTATNRFVTVKENMPEMEDGFHDEVHVKTMEGFWSLLRSWLGPRGISQEKLPLYLSFFEYLHNLKNRGKNAIWTVILAFQLVPQNALRAIEWYT